MSTIPISRVFAFTESKQFFNFINFVYKLLVVLIQMVYFGIGAINLLSSLHFIEIALHTFSHYITSIQGL